MRVEWSEAALADLESIQAYLSQFIPPAAALSMIDRLSRAADRLSIFPLSGRIVPEFELPVIREVIIPPYRVFYVVRPDRVDILAVWHSARDVPS